MRMGRAGPTAADLLERLAAKPSSSAIFRDYGDERAGPAPGARDRAAARAQAPFATSDDLVNAIRAVLGPRCGPGDFARLFQAVRIAVNDELGGLARALPALPRRAWCPAGVWP